MPIPKLRIINYALLNVFTMSCDVTHDETGHLQNWLSLNCNGKILNSSLLTWCSQQLAKTFIIFHMRRPNVLPYFCFNNTKKNGCNHSYRRKQEGHRRANGKEKSEEWQVCVWEEQMQDDMRRDKHACKTKPLLIEPNFSEFSWAPSPFSYSDWYSCKEVITTFSFHFILASVQHDIQPRLI